MNPSDATNPVAVCPSARTQAWSAVVAGGRMWTGIGLLVAVVALLTVNSWPDATERETDRWLSEFKRVRQESGMQRLPDWPLSVAGQSRLVRRLTQPESKLARQWDDLRQRLPTALRNVTPRLPLARDRLKEVGMALIELPKTPALRMALLDAALIPDAANRRFAVQFATIPSPVPARLLPWFERLASDEDVSIRFNVALALRGMPPGDPRVERLLGQLQADQVSSVREAAHLTLPSTFLGVPIRWLLPHASPQ